MKHWHTTLRSWRRWLFIAFPPLAAVLFALALTLPALADQVYNMTVPTNFTVTNPCNGENVALSGNEHETLHTTIDSNGGHHSDIHANLQDVKGIGDQGNTYTIPGQFHGSFNGQVGSENTLTETFNVISTGSAPNFVMQENTHITVNPDGTVTSTHGNFRTECTG